MRSSVRETVFTF